MAAQRVPGTPKEIKEWLTGTTSVPKFLIMPSKENCQESSIVEYSPEMSESGRGSDFAYLRRATIKGSRRLLLEHSGANMEVDVEGLLLCETPNKNLL